MEDRPDPRRETRFRNHEQYLYWLAKVLLAGITLYVGWWIITRLSGVLVPIFVSLLVAYLLKPLVDRLTSWKVPRVGAIALIAAAAIGTLIGFLFLVVPTIAEEMAVVIERLPEWFESRIDWIVEQADSRFGISADQVDEALRAILAETQRWGLFLLQGATESASNIVNLILIPVFTIYFLADFDNLVQRPLILIPERFHATIRERAHRMDRIVGNWIRGQLKVAGILAVIFAVSLTLLNVKLGAILGIVAGLLNVIPFVGSFTGGALAILMVLLEGPSLLRILTVLGLFVAVQTFESYWLTPRIVGSALGFGPLTIIIAILIGGALFGFLGVLIAVPATAAGTVLVKDLLDWYHETDFWKGSGNWTSAGASASADTGLDSDAGTAEPAEGPDRESTEGGEEGGEPAEGPDAESTAGGGKGGESAEGPDAESTAGGGKGSEPAEGPKD